jgi:antitoxin component YwqK of YwqJK toxin-antitoxin module
MYRRTLYNDDAIYSVKEDKVYFIDEQGYKDYLKWVESNKFLDEADERTKRGTLLWNQGKPHVIGDQLITHDKNGKRLSSVKQNAKNNKSKILFDIDGNVFGYTTSKFGIDISITYNKDLPSKLLFVKKNKILREVYYYPHTKQIRTKINLKDNQRYYTEYYNSGQVRAHGVVLDKETPHGIWNFYHSNGNKESEHSFYKGKLFGLSTVYHEDGSLNTKVNND